MPPRHFQNQHGFWQQKFESNQVRNAKYKHLHRETGWQRLVFWECQLKHEQSIVALIRELHQSMPDG